jgi:hypothetical protein
VIRLPYRGAICAAAYGLWVLFVLIFAAVQRGPWLDEFWSLWLTESNIPLETILRTRWLEDVHPPMFSALLYAMSKLIPVDLVSGRLFNLLPLLLSAGLFIYIYSIDKGMRRYIVVFSMLITSSYFFIRCFAEFRSYFLGICAFSVLIVLLRKINIDMLFGKVPRTMLWVSFTISVFLCLNVHYITALFTSIAVGAFGIYCLLKGKVHYFIALLFIGIISSAPLVAFAASQYAFLQKTSGSFWIDTSPLGGIRIILSTITKPIAAQFLPILVVILSIGPNWRQFEALFLLNPIKERHFIALLATVLAICISTIIVINCKTAIIQERYAIPLAIMSLAMLAEILDTVSLRGTAYGRVLVANCLILSVIFGITVSSYDGWYASAKIVKAHLAACPSSRVIAREWRPIATLRNEEYVRKLGYEYTSNKLRIPTNNLESKGSSDNGTCPDLIWIEHVVDPLLARKPGDNVSEFRFRNADYRDYDFSIDFDPEKTALVLLAKKWNTGP